MINRYINSIWNLLYHVTLHKCRVFYLGWRIRDLSSNRLILAIVLAIHDVEKYLFIKTLWKFYGKAERRAGARAFYDQMNKYGLAIQKLILVPFFWNKKAIQEAQRIEHIVDVVDRNTDPVAMEEFSLIEQRSMHEFLSDEDFEIAQILKTHWLDITSHLQYLKEE